jgi:CHAT domain
MACEIELEVGAGTGPGEFTARVVNAVSGGEPSATTHLDVESLLRDRDTLEAVVLGSGAPGGGPANGEEQLRRVGGQLFDALFVGPVLGTYRASMGVAMQRGEPLRVVLRLTAPRLAALPWEALYDPEIGAYICRKEPLVRRVPAPYTPEPLEVDPPLRVLGLVAAPRELPELDVTAEQQRLSEALAGPIRDGLIELDWLPKASWEAVQEKLLSGHWHVFHFIGHGDFDVDTDRGLIDLVDTHSGRNPVEARQLADLLREANPSPRLVVLNSCSSGEEGTRDLFSGTAAALVQSGVSAVAAMQFTVSDGAAIAFSRGFYTALAHGHGIDGAIRSGRISILGTPNTLEWVTPVLYVRGDTTDLFTLTGLPAPGPTRTTAAPQQDWRSPRAAVVPAEPSAVDSHGREGGTVSPSGRWVTRTRLAIAVGVSVVVALTAVALTWWMNRPVTRLEVVDLAVVQGDTQAMTPDNSEWELVPPKVQITLRNIGDQVSVITGAQLEVVDFTHLPICWGAGGALQASQTYDVVLPENPKPNDVIEVGIAQEVEPDRADKFELALQMRDADPALGTYLYRLKVSLIRDGGAERIEVGYAVVAAPLLNAVPFSRDELNDPDAGECFRRVAAEYQRAQRWEGERSADLSQDVFDE